MAWCFSSFDTRNLLLLGRFKSSVLAQHSEQKYFLLYKIAFGRLKGASFFEVSKA